jgi:hypothetical protein
MIYSSNAPAGEETSRAAPEDKKKKAEEEKAGRCRLARIRRPIRVK